MFLNILAVPLVVPLVTTNSGLPSASRSATAIAFGAAAVELTDTFASNERLPLVELFLNTFSAKEPSQVTATSILPSVLKSASAMYFGEVSVVKSTFVANEMVPLVEVFKNTETVPAVLLATNKSSFPSPSTSPVITAMAPVPVDKSTLVSKELKVIEPLTDVLR